MQTNEYENDPLADLSWMDLSWIDRIRKILPESDLSEETNTSKVTETIIVSEDTLKV